MRGFGGFGSKARHRRVFQIGMHVGSCLHRQQCVSFMAGSSEGQVVRHHVGLFGRDAGDHVLAVLRAE